MCAESRGEEQIRRRHSSVIGSVTCMMQIDLLAHVIDQHEQHHEAAHDVDRRDAHSRRGDLARRRRRLRWCIGGRRRHSCGTLEC